MMKSYGLFGFIGCLSLSLVFALPARAEDTPNVFISEINWAGSENSTADEWIELVNLGPTAVDLSHHVLTGAASSGGAIEIAEGTVIEPGHTLIIANYALGDPKTSLLVSPNLVTTALSLPNSSLDILLTTPAGLVIDNYTDTGTPDFGSSSPVISIARDLTTMVWQSSTQSLNLSLGTQLGTPGTVSLPTVVNNVPTAPIAEEPVVVESEPVTEDTPVEAPPSEPVVDEPSAEAVLLEPCIPVVLESNPPASSEPLPNPLPVIPETSQILDQETPEAGPTPVVDNSLPDEPNTPSVQKIARGELILNELVSDPLDGVEWIEILNTTSQSIDLSGSRLEDAGGHVTELPAALLEAGALLVIENPNGNLNNSGDTLTLFDAYGSIIDTLTYGTADIPAPQDGESVARNSDGAWSTTTASRNTINSFPAPPEDAETLSDPAAIEDTSSLSDSYETITNESYSPVSDPGTTSGSVATVDDSGSPATEPVHRIVAIAKSVTDNDSSPKATSSKKSNSEITVTGTVVALPDTFGKQIMFLDGHEIYFHAADWPILSLGDAVTITGTESMSNGARRVKISSTNAIAVTGHNDLVAIPVDGDELSTTPHGMLISVSGRVVGRSGNTLTLETENGSVITAISNKKTGMSWSAIQSGHIIVTGIAKHTDSGVVVAPRTSEDVHFSPDLSEAVQTLAPKPRASATPLVGGGLLTGSVGALGTWYLRSRKNLLSWLPF